MDCWAERDKEREVTNEQKWDYINLSDFRSTSCLTPLSYGVLYIFLLISVAVYAVDLYTCYNLLFIGRWSGQVKPVLSFHLARWIFTGCIVLSWILLVYRWWKAVRAIKSGIVAVSYLDPLAVRVQSIRMGANGRGWRRFLVFAALTKGRKGAEYVALFTYFSFEAWMRICFAEGPRQIVNALTLYSVMRADLVPTGQHAASNGHTPIVQFFVNVQLLANTNREYAAIFFGMLFTLIIWIFSALSLILAVMFYIFYLWQHIRDGSLRKYCRRKIDTRLHKIVMVRVNKALAKENKVRAKHDAKAMGFGSYNDHVKRQPTLPILDTEGTQNIIPISRQTTLAENSSSSIHSQTLGSSDAPSIMRKEPTVPNLSANPQRPVLPSRSITQSSNENYADDAPLINSAGAMGYSQSGPNVSTSEIEPEHSLDSYRPPPSRSFTGGSQITQKSFGSSTTRFGPPSRQYTDIGSGSGAPVSQSFRPQFQEPPLRGPHFNSDGPSPGPTGFSNRPFQEYEMQSQRPVIRTDKPPNAGTYVSYKPGAQPGTGFGSNGYSTQPSGPPPTRNFTLPAQRQAQYDYSRVNRDLPPRSGTAPIPQRSAFDSSYDGAWHQPIPRPPNPYGPGGWNGQRRPMPPR